MPGRVSSSSTRSRLTTWSGVPATICRCSSCSSKGIACGASARWLMRFKVGSRLAGEP